MVVAGHERALRERPEPAATVERQRTKVCAAVEMYLRLAGGEPRRALAVAVAKAVDAARMLSKGYARSGGPGTLT
jgi:hypothetical protein